MIASNVFPQLLNPIWQAATTRQRHFAYGEGRARRYYSEVLPMAALEDHSPEAAAALTAMVAPGERVWLFEEPSTLDARQWRVVRRIPGFQMACDAMLPASIATSAPKSVMLDPLADAAETIAVIIEEPAPIELAPLLMAAHGLTAEHPEEFASQTPPGVYS